MRYFKFVWLILLICVVFILKLDCLGNNVFAVSAQEIDADGVVLMESSTGEILYEHNKHKRLYPASTTKILTTYLLIQNSLLSEDVKVSENAFGVEGSSLYLNKGNRISVRDLAYGIMLISANDGAVAAAEHVAGSVGEFVQKMNKAASDYGAINTSFQNPHGLSDGYQDHKSTAYDLAMITRETLKCPQFKKIIKTTEEEVIRPDGERKLNNLNRLLRTYPGAKGVKTGYTGKAGNTLVAAATRENFTLIAVILGSDNRNNMFDDAEKLFDYGFENYKKVKFVEEGEKVKKTSDLFQGSKEVRVFAASKVESLLHRKDIIENLEAEIKFKDFFSLPLEEDTKVGYVKYQKDGKKLGKTELVVKEEIVATKKWFNQGNIILIVILCLATGFFVLLKNIKVKNKFKY